SATPRPIRSSPTTTSSSRREPTATSSGSPRSTARSLAAGEFFRALERGIGRPGENLVEVSVLQHGNSALGGALWTRHAPAQLGRVITGCIEQRGRTDESLLCHQPGIALAEALPDRSFGELLDEEEDIGGP